MDVNNIFPLDYTRDQEIFILEDFKPLHDYVLIVPEEDSEVKTAGGIILTGISKLRQYVKGTIVRTSAKESTSFKEGDSILYNKMMERTLPLKFVNKNIKLIVIKADSIVGII